MATETAQRRPEPSSNQLSTRPANSLEAAITHGTRFPTTNLRIAAEATARLIGSYPNGKPQDPETYVAAVAALLAEYPEEIVQQVTNPTTGIQRKVKFMPSLAEISDALEIEMVPLRRRWREAKQRRDDAERQAFNARALPDAQSAARVREGFKQLSNELGGGRDPRKLERDGTPPVGTSAGGAVARVIKEIAERKAAEAAE